MLYLFMSLWLLFGIMFIFFLIRFLVKREGGRMSLSFFGLSVICLIIGIVINGLNTPAATAEQPSEEEMKKAEFVIDVTQFALISPDDLTSIMGESESVETWEYSSPNGNKYQATTYGYDNGNMEIIVIDDKVVRFTVYDTGTFNSAREALSIFGIEPNPEFTVSEDNGFAIKYRNIADTISEFWLISDGNGKVDTLKVTYDSSYFE